MVFSSLQFIGIFLPIFFGSYYLTPNRLKNGTLLVGSLCFYLVGTWQQPEHFALFVASIIADYAIGILMASSTKHKKAWLVTGVVFHLICLGVFKYAGFIWREISPLFPSVDLMLDILLPIGISFYTFQGLSYLGDVYKGSVQAEPSLLKYSVYISMFAQLIAGPIVTFSEVKAKLDHRRVSVKAALHGIGTFIFGLGLKVLLANPIGKMWTDVCNIGFESISTPLAWMGIIAFSFQLYFDFFGYSLMAIGLGEMLGFNLPQNFDHPYTSRSMTEFWRRWHMTLGSWFREYVYIPLGGNRRGTVATVRNLLIVWVLTGVWHGAGYNFILWGTVLFFLIFMEKLFLGKPLNRFPVIGHSYMILLIPLTWAVFAIDDIGQLGIFFTRLFPFFGEGPWSIFRYDYLKYGKLYYPFFLAGLLLSFKFPYNLLKKIKNRVVIGILLTAILGASIYCMYRGLDDPFLYFRF